MIPPTGGPKDTLPPVLLAAQPQLNTLHFEGNKIVFTFDEYVDLKDARKELITLPVPKIEPTVEFKLKTVTVHLKDTLKPNTTYSLDFGNAIRDNNEGNILRHFTYTFSTGSYIDSLQLTGQVTMAFSGKADSTLIVMLHSDLDDSAVAKHRPHYITRLDSLGNYRFTHLAPGTYALYALKDESGTHEYTTKAQIFAFADSFIVLKENAQAPHLYAYQDTSQQKSTRKPLLNPPPPKPKKEDKDKPKKLLVSANLTGGKLDLHDQFQFLFQVPIKYFDSTKVQFLKDSFVNIPADRYHFEEDTTAKKVTLVYGWTPDTKYQLILQKDFAQDTLGQELLRIDTVAFSTKREEDYGNLRLRFKGLDLNRHPVLLFMQSGKIILSHPFGRSLRYENKLFNPGDYDLAILYDDNENGVWDPGDFFKHRQPEMVTQIKRKLTVKANWDNEVDISL